MPLSAIIRASRGSGRGSNIQKSSIVEEDEPPVEENKESPRIQEIDEDADNSPPIINDVDSDEEDSPVESKTNPVSSSPIILDLDGSSHNHTQSNRQIVASVKRGDDSRSEDTALTHHRLRVSWDNIESGKVRGPTDRRGLGFSGPHLVRLAMIRHLLVNNLSWRRLRPQQSLLSRFCLR
eukprot:scaffold1133_cov122-Isochrysis_galbana.AAC.2